LVGLLCVAVFAAAGLTGLGVWAARMAVLLVLLAAVGWRPSERYRRADELHAYAASQAASVAAIGAERSERGVARHFSAETLHSYAYPYAVGGRRDAVFAEMAERALEMLEAETPPEGR